MDVSFDLIFEGNATKNGVIDMYDAGQALTGFHRSLALTTHLIVNGEVITQAPALDNAQILLRPPELGSWKATAIVTAILGLGTASTDSLFGHLLYSAYHHVINTATGADVDYDNGPLQEQLAKHKTTTGKKLDVSRLDSVTEKCENSIKQMHRPIVRSGTARDARIDCKQEFQPIKFIGVLNSSSYEYISETVRSDMPRYHMVKVSSYNINTKTGRAFVPDFGNRTIPFQLSDDAASKTSVSKIISSMEQNVMSRDGEDGFIYFRCLRNESINGRLKSFFVLDVLTEIEYRHQETYLN